MVDQSVHIRATIPLLARYALRQHGISRGDFTVAKSLLGVVYNDDLTEGKLAGMFFYFLLRRVRALHADCVVTAIETLRSVFDDWPREMVRVSIADRRYLSCSRWTSGAVVDLYDLTAPHPEVEVVESLGYCLTALLKRERQALETFALSGDVENEPRFEPQR